MPTFQRTTWIDAPLDTVWQFHERPDVLQLLTPPWQPIEVLRRDRGLDVGSRSEFRLWIGPVPLRWCALHTVCEITSTQRHFIDTQTEGPFLHWTHRHQFDAHRDRQTRLTDTIDWELPGGPVPNALGSGWITAELDRLFAHRHQTTQRHCTQPQPPRSPDPIRADI